MSRSLREIQLEIWPLLEQAEQAPEQAKLDQIWVAWEHEELPSEPAQQLQLGAELILRLAGVVQARSLVLLQGLEHGEDEEPVVSEALLGQFVRQSVVVDLESFLEPPEVPDRLSQEGTQVTPVNKEVLLESGLIPEEPSLMEDLAHEEDIPGWVERIQSYLGDHPGGMRLVELHQRVGLPLISVWLSVLLGDLGIWQQGEFYQVETIWVDQVPSSSP